MFDLEQAIAEWRRGLVGGGIEAKVIDELESHLREEMERQARLGSTGQQAFENAVREMGSARALNEEFAKARGSFGHHRIYAAMLAAMSAYFAAGCGLFLWLSRISAAPGPLGLPYTPEGLFPWHVALDFAYAVATIVTLFARLYRPRMGLGLTRLLNWALLPVAPFGTVLGIYGLWKVDKEQPRYV